jgi:hypothetical protein
VLVVALGAVVVACVPLVVTATSLMFTFGERENDADGICQPAALVTAFWSCSAVLARDAASPPKPTTATAT